MTRSRILGKITQSGIKWDRVGRRSTEGMAVPPAEPDATADLEPEAGSARKLLLDEMLAERDRAPLPPAPVLTLRPVPVDAAPIGAGRRAALKRLAEVEALARNNLRAAEEAQRVMQAERQLLEEEASARTKAERTASALRRELERLRSTEEQRATQARFAAAHQAKSELANEMERVHEEHARVVGELDRMRGTLFDHDSLLDEYSQRLHDEQQAQAAARADLVRAEQAQQVAERNLEIAMETARRRAEDDHARFVKVEDELRDTVTERDRATTELLSLTTGDGEIARLRAQAAAANEDMTRLLKDLDVQAARADRAEAELVAAREACQEAERLAAVAERLTAEASEARDLAGISLETTRSELAERNEMLDAERSEAQSRIADLGAQLATATRTAESATERVADLEARLDATITAREEAHVHAEELAEQLSHAIADADQLRTHAASIGDELASTHVALDEERAQLADTRSRLDETRDQLEVARRPVVSPIEPPAEVEAHDSEPARPERDLHSVSPESQPDGPVASPSAFDAALASAFGDAAGPQVTPAATDFHTVESKLDRKPSLGPIVEHEAALLRQIAPVDPEPAADESDTPEQNGESAAEPEPEWRRTAMAALTSLASDDLTPRRRR